MTRNKKGPDKIRILNPTSAGIVLGGPQPCRNGMSAAARCSWDWQRRRPQTRRRVTMTFADAHHHRTGEHPGGESAKGAVGI